MNLGRSRGTLCYTLDLTRSNCCAKLLINKGFLFPFVVPKCFTLNLPPLLKCQH